MFSRIQGLCRRNKNIVYVGTGAIINIILPWFLIGLVFNVLNEDGRLVVVSIYVIVQLSVFTDLGLNRFFQLKARPDIVGEIFNWVLVRLLCVSAISVFPLYLFFEKLVGERSPIWFVILFFLVVTGAVSNLLNIRFELMGKYICSIPLKALMWILLFFPIMIFGSDNLINGVLCSVFLRSMIVFLISAWLFCKNKKAIVTGGWHTAGSDIYFFGFSLLVASAVDRLWPSLIEGDDVKTAMLIFVDVAIKCTFLAGVYGQAKINEYFQGADFGGVESKNINIIALCSSLLFVGLVVSLNYFHFHILLTWLVLLLLAAYTFFQSANQILVPLVQRGMSVRRVVLVSNLSNALLILFVLGGWYLTSSELLLLGLLVKSCFEYFLYPVVGRYEKTIV